MGDLNVAAEQPDLHPKMRLSEVYEEEELEVRTHACMCIRVCLGIGYFNHLNHTSPLRSIFPAPGRPPPQTGLRQLPLIKACEAQEQGKPPFQ